MKKISILLAAALTLAACQKNETPALIADTITAQIEQEAAPTKTYMDASNNIRWSEGDQIVGFMKSSLGLKYQILPSSVGKTSAFFEKVSGGNDYIGAGTEWDHNIVYYPYSEAAEAAKSGDDYVLNVVLPSEQNYAAASFGKGTMAMVAVSEDSDIIFRNVLGGMKLQLKGTQKVKSITLEGKNNEKLSGAAVVTAYIDETKPAITMSDDASTSVTLNCGAVQLNESTATEFIIALPPVLFSQGFTVTVTDSDTQTYTVETDKANTVLRSSLLVMPSVKLGAKADEEDITATIREFATEYVKLIDVWMKNVGTVNIITGIGANGDNLDIENAHYIPDETTITVGETVFNLADALELASRSYLLLRGYDGHNTTIYGRNLPMPKADKDYTMDSNIPETHSYSWGSYPYAEQTNGGWFRMVTEEGEFELVKTDLLDDYSHRNTNFPNGAGEGAISNLCVYTENYLPGYVGTCCSKRIMMAYAHFFKYMLDNNLEDAKGISADQTFNAPLFDVPANASKPTIRAFAEEYVKFIDIWKNTTGTVNYLSANGVAEEGVDYGVANIENGHYIPLDTKITVAGAEYTTSEVFDIAIRAYMVLRGIDATDETSAGAGKFGKLEKAYTMDDNFLPARAITWGPYPFNETGVTNADGSVSGNGGNLKKGTPPNGEDKVDVALLDNFAERNCNCATLYLANAIANMSSYTNRLDGYYGCASGHRMLLTYAYFFKYMLDNYLSDATQISADQTFESYNFGEVSLAGVTTDYVDEYGVNHGPGIKIDKTVWAPVNCGYHKDDFKYGKLYQWGRKYGQGFSGSLHDLNGNNVGTYSDTEVPAIVSGQVDLTTGQSKDNENIFYRASYFPWDWLSPQNDVLWNSGTEENPIKTEYDPCPAGWRVPTDAELRELCQNYSSSTSVEGQPGYWFSGASSYTENVPQVFFPAAGCRYDGGYANSRGSSGMYWSSRPSSYGAYILCFITSNVDMGPAYRAAGYSVRCVQVID